MQTSPTIDQNPFLLPAYLGLRPDWKNNRVCVRICSWCSSAKEVEIEARRLGYAVTNGICGVCAQRMIAETTGDRSDLMENTP